MKVTDVIETFYFSLNFLICVNAKFRFLCHAWLRTCTFGHIGAEGGGGGGGEEGLKGALSRYLATLLKLEGAFTSIEFQN